MKYLNLFDDHNEYLEYLESEDFTYPNISYCYEQSHIHFNKSDIIITAEFIVNDIQNPIKIYGYNDDPVKQYSFIFYGVEHFDEITVNGNIVSIEELDENEGMYTFNDTSTDITFGEFFFPSTQVIDREICHMPIVVDRGYDFRIVGYLYSQGSTTMEGFLSRENTLSSVCERC